MNGLRELVWVPQVLSIEIRKNISYRVDFWVSFAGGVISEIAVAYFLWKAIFEFRHADSLGGYTFRELILYYVLAAVVGRVVRGPEQGVVFVSQDIYEGSLNRYLVFPLPFLGYRYVAHLSNSLIALLQLVLVLGLTFAAFGWQATRGLTAASCLAGAATALVAGLVYFILASILEMVAFWADNVWSLIVMLRFCVGFLGGAMIPLSLFPEGLQRFLECLPFAYLISFPIRVFMGRVGPGEWLRGAAMLALWGMASSACAAWVWSRGTRQYTGVGI